MGSMGEGFNSEFFAGNRERLRKLFTGKAPIVITAAGLLQQGGDSTYPFHQDANFWYLTGIDMPDLVLVIDKDKEYLIRPPRSEVSNTFDGVFEAASLSKNSGIAEVLDEKLGWKRLNSRIKKVKHVATLAPLATYVDVFGFYTNPARATLMARIKETNPNVEPLDLRQHLSIMRMVKQPVELTAIRRAVDNSVQTFKDARKSLHKQEYEYELEAILSYGFRRRGSDGHAYAPIVAAGKNACTLHYEANNQKISDNDLVLIDAGAQVNRYAADISRTYSKGSPNKRQRNIYDAVIEVQDYAFSQLKPGISIRENEKLVEQFMGEKLRSLGLIKNVERDEIRKFFPHATSHFLGLDVHDSGDYGRLLEPGVVLTVEPGIYVPDEAIGVRIEDDVVITKDGIDILSKKLSRDL